jgi:uncharacterized membrane protein YdjX (TVP38/TMEM64 family)
MSRIPDTIRDHSRAMKGLSVTILCLVGFIVVFAVFHYLDPYPLKDWIYLRIALHKIGVSGLLIFILCVATVPLAAPLSLLIMAGSSAYGAPLGIVLSYVGCLLNANLTFFLVKNLGIEHSWGHGARTGRLKSSIQGNGYLLVLILQLLTFIPFTLINSAAAASGVCWKDFMKATLFGIIPSIAIFSLIGEVFASTVFSPRFYFALVSSMVFVITLAALLKKNARVRSKALS